MLAVGLSSYMAVAAPTSAPVLNPSKLWNGGLSAESKAAIFGAIGRVQDFKEQQMRVAAYNRASGEGSQSAQQANSFQKKATKVSATSGEALKRMKPMLRKQLELSLRKKFGKKLSDEEITKLMEVADRLGDKNFDQEKISQVIDQAASKYVDKRGDHKEDLNELKLAVKDSAVGVLGLSPMQADQLGRTMDPPIMGLTAEKAEKRAVTITTASGETKVLQPADSEQLAQIDPKYLAEDVYVDSDGKFTDINGNEIPALLGGGKGASGSTNSGSSGASSVGAADTGTAGGDAQASAQEVMNRNHAITVDDSAVKKPEPTQTLTQNSEGTKPAQKVSITPPASTKPSKEPEQQSAAATGQTPISGRGLAANEQPRQQAMNNAEQDVRDAYNTGGGNPTADDNPMAAGALKQLNDLRREANLPPMTLAQVIGQIVPPSSGGNTGGGASQHKGAFYFVPPANIGTVNNLNKYCEMKSGKVVCSNVTPAEDLCAALGRGDASAKKEFTKLVLNEAIGIDGIDAKQVKNYYSKLDGILAPPAPAAERKSAFALRDWLKGTDVDPTTGQKIQTGMVRMDACEGTKADGPDFVDWFPKNDPRNPRYENLKDSWCYNLKQRTQMNNAVSWDANLDNGFGKPKGGWAYGDRVMQAIYACANKGGAKVIAQLLNNPALRKAADSCGVPEAGLDPLEIRNLKDKMGGGSISALQATTKEVESRSAWSTPRKKQGAPANSVELGDEFARLTGQTSPSIDCSKTNKFMKFVFNAALNPRFPIELLSPQISNKPQMYYVNNPSSGAQHGGGGEDAVQETYVDPRPTYTQANAYGKVLLPAPIEELRAPPALKMEVKPPPVGLKATQGVLEVPKNLTSPQKTANAVTQTLTFKRANGSIGGIDMTIKDESKLKANCKPGQPGC